MPRFAAFLVLLIGLMGAAAADDPVARWDFGAEESVLLTAHGQVLRDQAGPLPPEFPDFGENNTAVKLDGNGSYLSIDDPGPNSPFDFTNGDSLTLEAWVHVTGIREGQPMYVIGKGRTNSPRFARDNQNWALRVVGAKENARLSFLFATKPQANSQHWHRWTSQLGFPPASGWHHIAVAYRFGRPDSIRGWVDGRPTTGSWDMGGPTRDAPVVDDDAIWIGSSMGGSPGNSFDGRIDAVAVHRVMLDDKTVAGRFRRIGGPRVIGPLPEIMPALLDVPDHRVLVQFCEGLPTHERWLNEGETWPKETARWFGEDFLLPRIPVRFDDWGIRSSWGAPLLVRLAGDVELPPGKQRFLLRARALGRLWVDGQVVARTAAVTKQPPNGEEPITPVDKPPLPGLRLPGYHQQEVFGEATIEPTADGQPRRCRVVLELVVGGKNQRTETGEVCVALLAADGSTYEILSPNPRRRLPLTDAAIEPELTRIEDLLTAYEDKVRRTAATSQDDYWNQRHEIAREWARQHPAPDVPERPGKAAANPIDRFLDAKIAQALADSNSGDVAQQAHFYDKVLPILRENCFRCHGDKAKGGLKLNSRAAAIKGGDSEIPAVVPGDLEASEMISRIRTTDTSIRMPPTETGLAAEEVAILEDWIKSGAAWPAPPLNVADLTPPSVVDDAAFLRRVSLDLLGVPPTADEAAAFLSDSNPQKRQLLIDRLLSDDRLADRWMSFWLDLLAENPTLLNASLNSTGPFRWFLYDSLRDHKPLDRMVTELLLLRGSPHEGGSAGFGIAAENDSPFAAKGHIVASTFLGIELQCARCHDSPYHSTTQRDLYSLAAMFARKPVTVPETSRVPAAFFEKPSREPLIVVSLKPDDLISATWPFAEATGAVDGPEIDRLMRQPDDTRERLAALVTAPQNLRFSRVFVNRLWQQLIGAGLVEPADDWEGREPSHPEMLEWLAHELIAHDYDKRHILRLIVTSQVYQREAIGRNRDAPSAQRFFAAPDRRRLSAEQVVDSLHVATGTPVQTEELTFVHDGRRPVSNRLTLGRPTRAWMFADIKNERDRPSLSLPRARTVLDVLEAFGWTAARQEPVTERETDPNVLQPGILANGTLTMTLTRASIGSELADLAVEAASAEELVDTLFLRILTRRPTAEERAAFVTALSSQFSSRIVPANAVSPPTPLPPLPLVTWFNHLQSDANSIQQERERRVRLGPPADPRLRSEWREVYEDFVWSLINHREFVWMP